MGELSRNAPRLDFQGQKWIKDNEQRITVADRLLVSIGKLNLTANERLILILLLGQKEGFRPTETFVRERTGMTHQTYMNARKGLEEKCLIHCEPYKEIVILIDQIEKRSKN